MPEVDYDSLAKEHGATVSALDYDSLAKEHGAVASTTVHNQGAYDQFRQDHPILAAPADALQGIGAGVISTARGISQIAHKAIPAIPEIPESYATAPDSIAGKVGKFGEQAAEFAVPAAGVSKLTNGASMLWKMAAQGAAAGGVSAVQSGGDPVATGVGVVAGAGGPVLDKALTAAGPLLSKLPERLYQSALKPTWSMAKKQGLDDMLGTGLREKIPVSAEGLNMVENKIGDLRQQITDGILANSAQGKTVDTYKVLQHIEDLKDFYKQTAAPEEALNTLNDLQSQFQQYHGQNIPLDKAQQIKINTYKELKNSYGQMASAKVEGLKQVARGLKDQISTVFPEISDLNEKQSKLMGLDEALTRAVWRIENHQMMGIGSGIAAGAGGAIAGGPGAAGAFVAKLLLDDPGLKSKLAIALSRSGVKNAGAMVASRSAAFKGAIDKAAESISVSADQLRNAPTQALPKAAQNDSQNPVIAGIQQ